MCTAAIAFISSIGQRSYCTFSSFMMSRVSPGCRCLEPLGTMYLPLRRIIITSDPAGRFMSRKVLPDSR